MDGRLGGLAWAGVQCGVLCALSDPVRRLGQREALDAARAMPQRPLPVWPLPLLGQRPSANSRLIELRKY